MIKPDTQILEEAADAVYGRDDDYGTPEDNFGTIARMWNIYLRSIGVEVDAPLESKDVAYMMILLKVSRAANGDGKRDNDVDIAGYAESAARIQSGEDDDGYGPGDFLKEFEVGDRIYQNGQWKIIKEITTGFMPESEVEVELGFAECRLNVHGTAKELRDSIEEHEPL